jgi:hypothetical protein
MASREFAHLNPLTSHLAGRTLALGLGYFPGEGALQAKHAPRAVCREILRPKLEQTQREATIVMATECSTRSPHLVA